MKSELLGDPKTAAVTAEREAMIMQAMKDLVSTPQGREFVWWLLEISTVKVDTFYGNSRDAYFSGRRAVGRAVEHYLAAVSPEAYVSMIKQGQVEDGK